MGSTLSECAGLVSKNIAIESAVKQKEDQIGDQAEDFIISKKCKHNTLVLHEFPHFQLFMSGHL